VLAVCDFSQVEARALAWAAGDHDALKVFQLFDAGDKVNGDPYRAMAARIYGKTPAEISKESTERKIGKIAELACGYGQGAGGPCHPATGKPFGFHGFSVANGADWSKLAPLTPKAVVDKWRELHEPIVSYWRELERAAMSAVDGIDCAAGPFEYLNCDGLVVCRLPSGRPLVYRGLNVSRDERGRPSLAYTSRKGAERTYGGKLAENAIQAHCRDLMARSLVEAEREGLRPVLTIHDEIICEVPVSDAGAAFELLRAIMHEVPPWAAGMPLAASGHTCERYHK
jgi:DNA polymerase